MAMHSAQILKPFKIDQLERDQIDIVGEDIHYYVKVKEPQETDQQKRCCKTFQKELLRGVDVIFKSGEVSAIMGASGAGKTTLLNVLAYRVDEKRRSGNVYANNDTYDYIRFGDFANYVMQSDILFQTLTVQETLEFAADLKINASQQQKKALLNKLVRNLKLEKCVDVPIGGTVLKGISGGQRKRVSIAFELLSDPKVIMLDEPTSGLDSLTAFVIIKYLKRLAVQERKTVIMTIHQPSSEIFAEMDRLMLMVNGKAVYQGPAKNAVDYFLSIGFRCPQFHNPADYMMSIIHHQSEVNRSNYPLYFKNYEEKLLPTVRKQIQEKRTNPIHARQNQVGTCTTLRALLKRDVLNIVRNPLIVRARIAQAIFMGLFAGGLFFGITQIFEDTSNPMQLRVSGFRSIIGAFFFLTIMLLMGALSPVALTFPIEREVFLKQNGARLYSVFKYFLSRNIVEVPFMIIAPLLISIIMYWMLKLAPTAGQFFLFFFIAFLITVAGASLGLLIGSLVSDPKLVSVMIPVFILPIVLFGGLYKNRGDYPVWIGWLEYISPNKYGFNAFVLNQYPPGQNADIDAYVNNLGFDLGLWPSVAILIALSFTCRALSLFFLSIMRRRLE